MAELLIGFWLGGAVLEFCICEAPLAERLTSSALWFTFPLWR